MVFRTCYSGIPFRGHVETSVEEKWRRWLCGVVAQVRRSTGGWLGGYLAHEAQSNPSLRSIPSAPINSDWFK